ncbi:MocR-like ectoine utilization transcription factor EhuR [Oceanospirillum sediminis]|uniref:PLP-dependent aminotransferase family protein n=1 Tax=Oceanospirillum sediminis TaxID=2760088 RepID=A0A839IY59_9GAMM|nr:PLP-dependent aminotransferase family protein [Oceanospirillum sediminis]MBB1489317.1 PLP-dependent aminotransferase family protein [Oceanospirillum sediminis]
MWNPDLSDYNGPRYIAIADAMSDAIKSGELNDGDRLPTHRALADQLGVTVGTITRAYTEAERRGFVNARVGRGTFIATQHKQGQRFRITGETEPDAVDLRLNLPVAKDRAMVLSQSMAELAAEPEQMNRLLGYQPDSGLPEHREQAVSWLKQTGLHASAENIAITNGGQNAIMLALLALTRPGDMILSEAMTYPGFMAITHQLHLRPQPVAMDDEGVIPSAFEDACKQFSPRVLYCTPTLQNPTTAIMSESRREALADVARRYNVWILEDSVNSNLLPDAPAPLAEIAPDRVLHINSASKTLAAGLRVGWLVSPPDIKHLVSNALRASCWMTSPLLAEIASRWIASGLAQTLLDEQKYELEIRNRLLASYLAEFGLKYNLYSLHAWLELPDPWRSSDFITRADKQGVKVIGEDSFIVAQYRAPQAIRLSSSSAWSASHLEKGLKELAALLRQEPVPVLSVF